MNHHGIKQNTGYIVNGRGVSGMLIGIHERTTYFFLSDKYPNIVEFHPPTLLGILIPDPGPSYSHVRILYIIGRVPLELEVYPGVPPLQLAVEPLQQLGP